jgi:hypothetical protein
MALRKEESVRRWVLCALGVVGLLVPLQVVNAYAGTRATTAVYEAESAHLGGFVNSKFGKNPANIGWAVASGRRGVNMSYAKGGTMTWSNVDGGAGGTATLAFQYANGGPQDRPLTLRVNGANVATVTFKSSRSRLGGFNSWWGAAALTIATAQAHLTAGRSNTVEFVAPESYGPHVDFMRVTAP